MSQPRSLSKAVQCMKNFDQVGKMFPAVVFEQWLLRLEGAGCMQLKVQFAVFFCKVEIDSVNQDIYSRNGNAWE